MTTAERAEAHIRKKRLLSLSERFVIPNYEGLSIANVPATLLSLFSIDLPDNYPTPLPEVFLGDRLDGIENVILLIIDALGYRRLREILEGDATLFLNRLVERGQYFPLTSVFPSTTTAAITTFATGLPPQAHGLVGYRLYLKEFGSLANMIRLSPVGQKQIDRLDELGFRPERFLGVRTIAEILVTHGVDAYLIIRREYISSGLSRMLYGGATALLPAASAADMFVATRTLLEAQRGRRTFVTLYWEAVDAIAHRDGPDAKAITAEVRNLSYSLETELVARLSPKILARTLLVVTADHGQTEVSAEEAIRVARYPRLKQVLLMPPAGEYRAAYLYAKQGKSGSLKRYLTSRFNDRLTVLDAETALADGLFGIGASDSKTRDRIGDLIVIAHGPHTFYYPYGPFDMRGMHGSLTPDEMLVPLLWVRLGHRAD